MRKLLMSLIAMFLMAGLVVAVEGVVTKVDVEKKKVTIKVGDADKEFDVTDKTTFQRTDNKGENAKDSDLASLEKSASRKDKDGKVVGAKVEYELDGTKLKSVKWRGGGKKN